MGFENANRNEFHGYGNLIICLLKGIGKVMEIFLKEFVLTLSFHAQRRKYNLVHTEDLRA